jgi:hypothetical protein
MDFKGIAAINNLSHANASFFHPWQRRCIIPFAQRQRLAEAGRAEKIKE